MKKILYTGAFRFPDGDAAAARVFSVGQLFSRGGATVSFAGWEKSSHEGGHYWYHGHDCYSQSEFREGTLGHIRRLCAFFLRGSKTLKWIWRNRGYDVVVAYNPPVLFSLGLLLCAKLMGVQVVLDSTEWYEGSHLPGGRFGPAAIENWLRMRVVYPLFRHVICISHFLERHFEGRNVINVPPLTTEAAASTIKPPISKSVCFIYAGDAGKKDRLLPFIRVLPSLSHFLGRPVLLRIAGLEWNSLCSLFEDDDIDAEIFRPFVECHGRISRNRVFELYGKSHFSVIFREDKRYARAGFPTKAMESWSHGCPIITNKVGDLGELARDKEDSIIVEEGDLVARLGETLKDIIDGGLYSSMSIKSRTKALEMFTLNAHGQSFALFMERLGVLSRAF
jgi:glycosyltransferase involved in cell wall biosynthesis